MGAGQYNGENYEIDFVIRKQTYEKDTYEHLSECQGCACPEPHKTPTLVFDHQTNMDDWLIVEKIEDVLVGSSKPYN